MPLESFWEFLVREFRSCGKLAASGRENALLSIAIQEKSAFRGMACCCSDINLTITWQIRKCQV